ncbi:Serine/threonine-protein kinase PrkC [Gimesia aquarii]|uniref:Serine/threonine-protein kinase PrkC n=1 Tax=Gimesia aquarii TaxID=2527964 RepID=A0A517WV69_9PLAN|nr:Serine/threonine-protein kinase PrkC [Gimesia aquarii]
MLEPPSKELIQRLTKLKLCTPADLKRCRRRVKKLARGIPAFDSVWIDALVQAQKITPFQARTLESGNPEQLAIGPYLLISELGHSHKSNTYIANVPESTERCVLKITRPQSDNLDLLQQNAQKLLQSLKGLDHPSLVYPRIIKQLQDKIVIVSRYVLSATVSELLIRRGRFPVPVVLAIGAQLLDALVSLEKRKIVHSDIRPWNVRLSSNGIATLVDTGIESILSPELTIHASLPPRCYDGIAPELIGTGNFPNCQSDIYALGCLLWELLASRPPFTTGDPLAKLACHQTKTIPDIRTWAPETPDTLAEALLKLTASNPEQRPSNMQEAQNIWPTQSKMSHKILTNFYSSFDSQVIQSSERSKPKKTAQLSIVAALIFVLSGLSLTLLNEGARNQFLKITSQVSLNKQSVIKPQKATSTKDENQRATSATSQPRLIPPPNEQGIILLDSSTPYEPTKITTVGSLVIRGPAKKPAIININEDGLTIVAEQLTLENVILINLSENSSSKTQATKNTLHPSLLNVTTQSLILKSCFFAQLDDEQVEGRKIERDALYWKLIDPQKQNRSQLEIYNSMFAVSGHAIHLTQTPQSLSLINCLNITSRSTFFLEHPPEIDHQINLNLRQLTLREAGPLMLFNWNDAQIIPGAIQIEAKDCVFDLAQSALFQVAGFKPPENWLSSIGFIGEGSIASSEIRIAAWQQAKDLALEEFDASTMRIEGLSTGKFEYAAPLSLNPEDSMITEAQVPRKSALPPGIQAEQFPDFISRIQTLKN